MYNSAEAASAGRDRGIERIRREFLTAVARSSVTVNCHDQGMEQVDRVAARHRTAIYANRRGPISSFRGFLGAVLGVRERLY